MRKFVHSVYSRDYVPFEHLASKVKYLMQASGEVAVVVFRNSACEERVVGEGWFAHVECMTVRRLKDELRQQFNPRVDGKRSEDHVIHASDHESHTDHLLTLIGETGGLGSLKTTPNPVLAAPHHLRSFKRFRIRMLEWNTVRAVILSGSPGASEHVMMRVEDTPHFKFLAGDKEAYVNYLNRFRGTLLKDGHCVERFEALLAGGPYLAPPRHTSPVLVKVDDGGFRIVDGLHRACVERYRGSGKLIAAVIA
jgi:hypothetical protein